MGALRRTAPPSKLLGDVGEETKGPVGKSRRFMKLAGMTASVAGNYARSRVKSAFLSAESRITEKAAAHEINGQRIAETLGELKGAVMKVGQMASIATDVLPKELATALSSLQKEAPPMPYSVIAEQIRAELGSAPELLFDRFDAAPFAAASIGQVHRARTDDGREVVVKVQYPGVDESCDSDLAHLKIALKASGLVRLERKVLNQLFEEMRARLHEELDYCNEADNVRLFRKFHAQHDFVVVPDVVGERSAQRVLTLTYEPGDHINELDRDRYPQAVRNQIGVNMFHMLASQLVHLQAIHADPNPANLAFRPDGTIVLYDFGCVKKPKPEIITSYMGTLQAAIDERYDEVEAGMLALGARNPKGPPVEADYYKLWRDILLVPFIQSEPFDYGSSMIHEGVMKHVPGLLKRLPSFSTPPEVVFIDRAIVGHYGNLRNIGCQFAPGALLPPYVEAAAPQ